MTEKEDSDELIEARLKGFVEAMGPVYQKPRWFVLHDWIFRLWQFLEGIAAAIGNIRRM